MKHKSTPKVLLVILITAGLYFAALNVDAPLLYLLTSLFVSFLIISWITSRRNINKIQSTRIFPFRTIYENQLISLSYELKNLSKRRYYAISIKDSLNHSLHPQLAKNILGLVYCIPKKETVRISFEHQFPKRGRYSFGPVQISSDFPFGLFRKVKLDNVITEIKVYPELIRLSSIPELHDQFDLLPFLSRSFPGQGDEFYSIREYRYGDPLKHIHWKGTARHRELMVREVQKTSEPGLNICMDSHKDYYGDNGLDSLFETTVKIAAAFSCFAHEHKYPMTFSTQNTPVLISFDSILNYLADCQQTDHIPFQKLLLDCILNLHPNSTLFVVFPGYQQGLLPVLQLAKERHIKLVLVWLRNEKFLSVNRTVSLSSEFRNSLLSISQYFHEIYPGDSIENALQTRSNLQNVV